MEYSLIHSLVPLTGSRRIGFAPRLGVNGMRHCRRMFVLFPNLNRLVGLSSNQSRSGMIKGTTENALFGLLQTARLDGCRCGLKVVAGGVIPKIQQSLIASTHHHPVFLHRHTIPNCLWFGHFLQILAVLSLPFPYLTIGAGTQKGPLQTGTVTQGPNGLLVVRQGGKALAGHQVPHFNGRIVTGGNDLGMEALRQYARYGVFMATEYVHLGFGAHVPHSGHGVPAGRHQQIQGGMEAQRIHATQVAVIMAHHLIRFQIPTLDRLVFPATKQVGMPFGKGQSTDGGNVARQCIQKGALFMAGGGLAKIPNFNGPVGAARG